MESRVETHTPAKPEMERKNKSIPTKLHWLSSYIYAEIRTILSSDWEQNKLIGCMDFYLRCAREESVKGKKTTNLTKIIPRNMYLFKDMNTKFGPTPAYLDRIAKMLQLYLDAELRVSIQGIIFYKDIANKISMQIDAHLKGHDPSYILSVFLTSQRSQIKSHRRVLDLLYGKYLTVQRKWSVNRTELPDRLMLMYVIAYKQWVNLFLDDKTKVLNIMKEFTMFKPRDSFTTNPKIPESLRTVFSQSGLVKELLTTSEKVDVLKKGLDSYLDEEEHSMEDFLVDDLTKMTMTIGESQDISLSTTEGDSSVTECPTVSRQENVPMPLSRSAMSRVVKQEEPQTLAIIDLTIDETQSQPRQWLQNLVRLARDKQEVAMTKSSSSSGVADVICLSDSDESDGQNDVGVSPAVNSVETTSESPMNITDNLMDWAEEGANSMAKNREMLDSITSNLDETPNPHKLSPQQRVEKTSLTSANATKTAMKFGVRDDLVGSSPRKVTTGESVGETSICTAEDNSLSGGVEDSQNSVDNYPIFNEIRMVERSGENYERVTDIEAPPMDHGDYFCDDLEEGCSMMRTSNPDPKNVGEKRRRQSTDGQPQQENIVFTMPPLTRRPLATDDDPAVTITIAPPGTPSDKILFSTSNKSPQLPIDESLNIIVRDIMADFSDVEEDDILPDDEDVSMDEEPDIESPTMETIEKAELVEFMEQICESGGGGHQDTLAEPIKSILDRSTAKEKSAKVKKTVKFGTAQYLEPDDVPLQRFAVDYFGGMSPRKAILKSSLKRTLQNAVAGVSCGGAESSARMIPSKDYTKTPMSNIMVKRTYLSPDMLPHCQQSRSVSHTAAPLTTESIVRPSESSETDLSSEISPTTKIVEKEGKKAIRREFVDRRKKMKRRNSIACINYTEPTLVSEAAKEDPAPAVTEPKRSEKADPKLFAAYVSLVRISEKRTVENLPSKSPKKKSNHVPDPSTATSPYKMSKEMREKPWRDYPLYTGLTPTRMTRSMRRRILELDLQDDDATPLYKRRRPRLMSTIELVSVSRVRENSSEAVLPKVVHSPMTSIQSQESPVPSVVENQKAGYRRPPRRKSICGESRNIVEVQSEPEVVLRQNLNEFNEVAESQQKVVPDTKNLPISPVTKASKKEIVSPVVQLQESSALSSAIVGQDVKDSSISIVPGIPKPLTLGTPIVQVERLKKEINSEIKTSPKTSPTLKSPRRQDLIPLTKQTMKIIRKDVKLHEYRAIVRTRRLTMSNIERVVDHVAQNTDSNVDSLMKDEHFFHMQSTKNDGNSADETSTRQDDKISTVDPATDIPDETTDQFRQENIAESCMEGIVDACTNDDDESSTGKNSKRGRRSEGKRSKTPRRLKRSQSYQKIIEHSLVVMEQIQVKPLSLLSLNEEIGKMASPDSTSSHGEVKEQFQGKAVSPEYVNPSISSTVNTEISSTTQIVAGCSTPKQQGDKSPSQVNRKQHRLGFNGPVLRSMSGGMTSRNSSSPLPPNTEAVSCDSQGDLGEPKKGKTPQCDSQMDEKSPENHQELSNASDTDKSQSDETIEKQIEEIMKEGGDVDKYEEEKSKESPLGCDSQGDSEQCQSEVYEKTIEPPEDNAEERMKEDIPMKVNEEKNCKSTDEKEDETIVPVTEERREEDIMENNESEEEIDDESIDFQDFDSFSDYSNVNSPSSVSDNDRMSDKPETTACDLDKSTFEAAMMHFDPSDAFKDTSDIESQDEEVEETHNMNLHPEMHEKDNLFENISSIESTEQNYLVDNCALLTGGHQVEEENETKNPSPDSSNVHNTSSAVDSGDPMDISCDAMPDTSVNFLPSTNENDVDANTLGIDDQQRYVEHDGLFSSPIYDPEPLDDNPVDQRSKFNGQIAHQLMYSENQLLEADSSENIGENLAIDDLVEEMPSDETTLITESDIFEEYCENLTSIGDNVTVETESEIVTEPFGGEEVARQTTDTVDFSSVFKTCLPEMTSAATSLSAVSSSFLSSTFPSDLTEVTATRKSYRQRIKSHTNLYVGHDYSPKTDTNRVTPTSTKTGDRYLLPPKSDRLNRKRTFSGDGRERRKNRHKVWTNITSYSYNPILPPPSTTSKLPPTPKVAPTSSVSSVSSYLEVHNSLQQQIEKESRMPPMFPMPSSSLMSINGEGNSVRKYRRLNRMEHNVTPHHLPVYEQISPCMTETRVKAFKMIPSNQSIAALETMAQKRPQAASGTTIEILSDRMIQPRREGAIYNNAIGGYELMTQNSADFCIISGSSRQNEQVSFPNSVVHTTHTDSKAFLTPQPEELPHFVVQDTDLVADCLDGVK